MFGSGLTVITSTSAVVLEPFAKVWADSNEIFWIILGLVQSSTSFLGASILHEEHFLGVWIPVSLSEAFHRREHPRTNQTTASWKIGSSSLDTIKWNVGSDPMMSRKAGSYTWNGFEVASCAVTPGGTKT